LPAIHLQFATHPLIRRFQLFDSPHRLGNLGVLGADQALRQRDEERCLWDDLVLGELELDVRRRLWGFLEAHCHLHFAGYHQREILELGFPDNGCNYLGHLREIRNVGGGSAFYQNPKARLDLVPKDVKVGLLNSWFSLLMSANLSVPLSTESEVGITGYGRKG